MLPNHAPLVVAEQFALLEAAHPGRIDLGIGRAPGSDPVTSWALRHGAGGARPTRSTRFPEHVEQRDRDDRSRPASGSTSAAAPTSSAPPRGATSTPPVWLLGLLRLLRAAGGRAWACRTSSPTTSPAAARPRRWRSTATSSGRREGDRPRTFLTANAVVAETDEEAERLARPQLLAMVALRTGGELRPQLRSRRPRASAVPGSTRHLSTRCAAAGWSAPPSGRPRGRGAGRRATTSTR